MKKIIGYVVMLSLVIVIIGCGTNQPSYQTHYTMPKEEGGTNDMENQLMDAQELNTASEVYATIEGDDDVIDETNQPGEELTDEPISEEEKERGRIWAMEQSHASGRTNLSYIFRSSLFHAPYDVDMQTIERFIFSSGSFEFADGFVLDRMFGRVYTAPMGSFQESRIQLSHFEYSAEFIQQDLDRLIEVIEKSDLRNWQEDYLGEIEEDTWGGRRGWNVGILFSNGTVMLRGGGGIGGATDFFPPMEQWNILSDFVTTIGKEIQERHNAETAQGE